MRLALAQINPTVGDLDGNATKIVGSIARAREAGADLVVLPELAVTGYPPRDLLLDAGFVAAAAAVAKRIGGEHTAGIAAIFGVPLPVDLADASRGVANSLVVYRNNQYLDYYDKRLLPTYDVFDEDRYFTPGRRAVVVEIAGVRVGLAICEDLWKGQDAGFARRYDDAPDPVAELADAGAQLIVSPSSSPFVLGKHQRHRAICSAQARGRRCWVASINQAGANDELIFDGHAMLFAPTGELVACSQLFGDAPHRLGEMPLILDFDPAAAAPRVAGIDGTALLYPDPAEDHLLFLALTTGVRDYLRKTGFSSAIIGLSGGIDSALTAAVAAAALGPRQVLGVAMPGPYSSDHAHADAADLAARLGIDLITIPIAPAIAGYRAMIDPAFTARGLAGLGEKLPDLTEENLQSRVRGTVLMALSNRTGAMVLTTGNKSELAVGYCTLYGDMNGGLMVLSDVSKQWVYRLSRWLNANPAAGGFASPPIPESSLTKPPSAELAPNQKDQDTLPPYDVLDRVIELYIERRLGPSAIAAEAGVAEAEVRRLVRMIDLAEYKRKQAAVGLKVTTVAFGGGRRFPIAHGWRHGARGP